eukprot:4222729-Alexandrium_andersonii.AAC.1
METPMRFIHSKHHQADTSHISTYSDHVWGFVLAPYPSEVLATLLDVGGPADFESRVLGTMGPA